MEPLPFLDLARRFRAVFFDSYGVLKNHEHAIPGGPAAVTVLREENCELRVLTNDASRSPGQQAARFRALGYPRMQPGEIITSGLMARLFLREKVSAGATVAYLGTPDSARYVLDGTFAAVPAAELSASEYDSVGAVAFLDDEGWDWRTGLNAAVNLIRARNVPVAVANSDLLYPVSGGRVGVATGGLAGLVETLVGRQFMHFGKPDTQIFHYAFEDINRGDSYARREVLMVGDTLHTDILGGNKFGVQTCLVLSGNTSARNYEAEIVRAGVVPDFICFGIGA